MQDDVHISLGDRLKALGELNKQREGVKFSDGLLAAIGAVGGGAAVAMAPAVLAGLGFGGLVGQALAFLGLAVVAPVAWILGGAAGGAALVYALAKIVRSGGKADAKIGQIIAQLEEEIRKLEEKAAKDDNKTVEFIDGMLQSMLSADMISKEKATDIVYQISVGVLLPKTALCMLAEVLKEYSAKKR